MHWLRRTFVVYAILFAALAGAGFFYQGVLQRRAETRQLSPLPGVFASEPDLIKLRMERSTLEFQLPQLLSKFPVLTNAVLAREWSATVHLSPLDPDVRPAREAYLKHVSGLLLPKQPDLEAFVTMQAGYDEEAERISLDLMIKDKPAALRELQQGRFAEFFRNEVYQADRARFDAAAQSLTDDRSVALRTAYFNTLIAAVTNLNPGLTVYADARGRMERQAAEIRGRLNELNEQIGDRRGKVDTLKAWSRQKFALVVPEPKDFLIIEAATFAIAFLLTWPLELRGLRRTKIIAALALAYGGLLALSFATSGALRASHQQLWGLLGFLVPAAVLAALWARSAAVIIRNLSRSPGPAAESADVATASDAGDVGIPELQEVYVMAHQGHLDVAMRLIHPEQFKGNKHYEAAVLKAKLRRHLNQKWRAKWELSRLLQDQQLTIQQSDFVRGLLQHLNDLEHEGWRLFAEE